MTDKHSNDSIFCSFCGKNRREVRGLVASDRKVVICSECWEVATDQFASMAGCDPTVAYAVIKKDRLDQRELHLRRQMALVRTNEIVEIRGPGMACADLDELDDGPEPPTGGNVQDGGT